MSRSFSYQSLPGRVVFGPGTRKSLPDELDALGATRVLLVADQADSERTQEMTAILDEHLVGRFTDVVQHVPARLAAQATELAQRVAADAVVTVGGGSATGFGKALRRQLDVSFVAVPTTYAGSEMTAIWGTTEAHHKRTGTDPRVKPDTVVYDPELTLSLPISVAGPSAMNAMAHAVEALYTPAANPVASVLAIEAVRVFAAALPMLPRQPDDLSTRSDLLHGAYLAANALASAGTALHHKACHVLGGMFDLDHGGLNAVLLPYTLAYTAPVVPEVMTRLAAAVGTESGAAVPELLRGIATTTGAPANLRELGMPAHGIEDAAGQIVVAAAANPRRPELATITAMLRDAYSGTAPSTH